MIITSGNRNDIVQVKQLTEGFRASYLLANKGHDGNKALSGQSHLGTIGYFSTQRCQDNAKI